MLLQRLHEEEEEAGLLNLLFLILVSLSWLEKKKHGSFIKPPLSVVT